MFETPKMQRERGGWDIYILVIQVLGLRESRGRVARHCNSQNREGRKAKIDIKKGQVLAFWVSEVEEVRYLTTGFAKSQNPVSRNRRGNSSRFVVG